MNEKEERSLIAWLAVNVMGYTPVSGDYWDGACNPGKFNCNPSEATGWAFEYPGGVAVGGKEYCTARLYQWLPTTDVEHAMAVFDKCLDRYAFGIAIQKAPSGYAVFAHVDCIKNFNTIAETKELAICLFAKKVFEK